MTTLKAQDRVYYSDNGPDDKGTVVLISKDEKAVLVKWDDGQYDCAETVIVNGNSYFGEWFNVGSVQLINNKQHSKTE